MLQGMISLNPVDETWGDSGAVAKRTALDHEKNNERGLSMELVRRLWFEQEGQDIAEYAVMLAVILVIVIGTVRLIGSNANNVFSEVASSMQ
jgi:Flp pilus assembly pilin Flp